MGAVAFEQVQGLLRFGYRSLTECSFLLLRITDAESARRWLRSAPVSNAVVREGAPSTALQIAFTATGLHVLGLRPELLAQFSQEFQSGLAGDAARSRLLGDVGSSGPAHWAWGGEAAPVHVLLMLYAKPGMMAAVRDAVQTADWHAAFRIEHELATSDCGGLEPFGFPDGLSQPALDWERRRTPPDMEDGYTNQVALGEFLLGYPNEYRRYTGRPLLPQSAARAEWLPVAEEQPNMRDFGKNGCYVVLRTLEQDVAGFRQFTGQHSAEAHATQDLLAAAMVGRHQDGTPLATAGSDAIAGVAEDDTLNRFDFSGDPNGTACPFGAHIRRANPRTGDMPAAGQRGLRRLLSLLGFGNKTLQADAKASSRFHRLLRRGREYGTPPRTGEAAAASPCGIHFMCLVANIARQFEFVQSAWITSTKFDAMTDESDPLLGSREPVPQGAATDVFRLPREAGLPDRIDGLPRFVSVRGGAYFFLPSLPALRYLAASDHD